MMMIYCNKDEFERWQMKWHTHEPRDECPRNAIDSLHDSLKDFYPNINILLHLFATLPVTSASAERSFSCLKRLKTHLRNTMGEDRLSGLAMMEINRTALPSVQRVIDNLAESKRKLDIVLYSMLFYSVMYAVCMHLQL